MAERTAVITIAHGRHAHLREQQVRLRRTDPGVLPVVVAMDDPDLPGALPPDARAAAQVVPVSGRPGEVGLPLARARNAGARAALDAGADLLVFLDVDCIAGVGMTAAYARAAGQLGPALLCGPVTYLKEGAELPEPGVDLAALRDPHPARPAPPPGEVVRGGRHELFWSLGFALTADTWAQVGGFCEEYTGYGGEDTDFAVTARERGVELVWVGGADAYHQHHPVSRPPVEHTPDIVRNANLFHRRWGWWPMEGWLRELATLGRVVWEDDRLQVAADPETAQDVAAHRAAKAADDGTRVSHEELRAGRDS